MIDEKKLIEEVWSIFNSTYNDASKFDEDETKLAGRILRDVQNVIESFPKIGGWIPCSERLPEKSNSYLVTKHIAENEDCAEQYETCSEIFWTRDNKWDCERDPDCEWKVIAWQPLPEAYHE